MFERIGRSWQLVKASWSVLQADKELILFPIVSSIGVLIVTLMFMIPTFAAGVFDQMTSDGSVPIAGYIIGFLFYLVMYTVIIYSNTALVGAAMIRLSGGEPTVMDGFKIANERIGLIIQYAAISATVGMILRFLQERGGIFGAIASWIGGLAWNLATFLVIPVLVIENVSPVDAIKRSASLLKQTWGEQIVGNFSIGIIFGLLTFAAIIFFGLPVMLLAVASGSVFLVIVGIAAVVLVVVGINLIGSTLSGIYVAALYRYATEDKIESQYFSPELIEGAFRRK